MQSNSIVGGPSKHSEYIYSTTAFQKGNKGTTELLTALARLFLSGRQFTMSYNETSFSNKKCQWHMQRCMRARLSDFELYMQTFWPVIIFAQTVASFFGHGSSLIGKKKKVDKKERKKKMESP